MSRAQFFQNLANSARAVADLCDVQKDTVDWWTKFGRAGTDMLRDFQLCEPKNDRHSRTAETAARERSNEREELSDN